MIKQNIFDNTINKFNTSEGKTVRDKIWYMCKKLLKEKPIEAYILLLSTWNFARFRYMMDLFDLNEFEKTLNSLKPYFKKLEKFSIINIDLDEYGPNISYIYDKLAKIKGVEYTGATKIMALNNDHLFVMWDTAIRKMYNKKLKRGEKISQKPTGKDYINFLRISQKEFGHLKMKNRPSAKVIDEYNFLIANK